MNAEREMSIHMTTAERATMMDEPDGEGLILSATARAALFSAAPHPGGLPAWRFTCSMDVARELQEWAEAGAARWRKDDPAKSVLFAAAAKQVRFGLWKIGADPAP